MIKKSPEPALRDILDAIDHIASKLTDCPFAEFERDLDRRRIVERNVEIISEASRRLPETLKARHAEIPWTKVAAIGNILRHEYDAVSPRILWTLGRHELEALERVGQIEAAADAAARTDPA